MTAYTLAFLLSFLMVPPLWLKPGSCSLVRLSSGRRSQERDAGTTQHDRAPRAVAGAEERDSQCGRQGRVNDVETT